METCSKALICPVCEKTLQKKIKNYVCVNGHSFDISKQGYTNVWQHKSLCTGDNRDMVEARSHFLEKGFYQPLLDALLHQNKKGAICVDTGCGEGYYTRAIAQQDNCFLYAFDVSKTALKHAAKNDKNAAYFLSSIFKLPIKTRSVDIVFNIFAPFAGTEFGRVLKTNGIVVKVDPAPLHLFEMKKILYEHPYKNEISTPAGWQCISSQTIAFDMVLKQEDIQNLITMTPYFFKTKKDKIEALCSLDHLKVQAGFYLQLLQRV
ncbi:MAG: putative RNA methyltransferase [Breznakia sp.]